MKSLIKLLQTNRFARIALGATIGIGILVLILSSSNSPTSSPTRIQSGSTRPELESLNQTQRQDAIKYRTGATDALPIYIKSYSTSVGIETQINIFVRDGDPPESIRFEIYGLSYANPDTDPSVNPNIKAFQESFIHGLKVMRTEGLTPSRMIFLYSDIDYIRKTATNWVNHLGLLN